MKKKVMVTTLFDRDNIPELKYYYMRGDHGRVLYCDAYLPAEAACKYMLVAGEIDRIVIMGTEKEISSEDETGSAGIRDGRSLYGSDPNELTAYDLLRSRLAEFAGEPDASRSEAGSEVSEEEQNNIKAFILSFFENYIQEDADKSQDKYFHILAQNEEMQEAFNDALRELAPETSYDIYKKWVSAYLYNELRGSYKMEMLEANADVQIKLITLRENESVMFPKHILDAIGSDSAPDRGDGADIYLCIEKSEPVVILDIINMINMTNVIPDNSMEVRKTITTTCPAGILAGEVSDKTDLQSITRLLSGAEAFIKYGKTDTIAEYWEHAGIDDPKIERIIFAMRNIDNGISLCDIGDIERGIRSLREIISEGGSFEGNTPIEQALAILLEGVRRDYGSLLDNDRIEFMDLVRWAYRKEFWQQTLTVIESRAPRDFVRKGFYYYCDSEDDKQKVIKIFGQLYYDLKAYEKYKMDDLSHYYVKFYNRSKADNNKHGNEYIRSYANMRVGETESQGEDEIRACTACSDLSALEDLLFAYYYVGNTRNSTNHAEDTSEEFSEIKDDSDSSERMKTIKQCVDYFIYCYDKVAELTDSKSTNVIEITNSEITAYADEIRKQNRSHTK